MCHTPSCAFRASVEGGRESDNYTLGPVAVVYVHMDSLPSTTLLYVTLYMFVLHGSPCYGTHTLHVRATALKHAFTCDCMASIVRVLALASA